MTREGHTSSHTDSVKTKKQNKKTQLENPPKLLLKSEHGPPFPAVARATHSNARKRNRIENEETRQHLAHSPSRWSERRRLSTP